MYSDILKTGACWTGLSVAVVLLGLSLHRIASQTLPDLLSPLFVSGYGQIEMLNAIVNGL
jgi:hypothetical protein